ncbi:unnamed protein product [Didymodactylos carnosus]|uniref:Aminoacyl-tRNA synthetase class II (D/K/N) domain-containing protein n=1 Tax=Didymodactylos carnosus TaxID=1234261 RepID=A0A8S2FV88_9BILA|nr:unnamed protein product [Didymodactylos carnosus]CAF4344248.1 unnamed protein product [Didymodactylos carnosus]
MCFVDLADFYGLVQVAVVNQPELVKKFGSLPRETLVEVNGIVQLRKDPNPSLASGKVEIVLDNFTVVSASALSPIVVENKTDALEEVRLRHRYLDLRRPSMQDMLRFRAKTLSVIRKFLESNNFLEVETPILVRPSIEGAAPYLVEAGVENKERFALAQSPQLYKQMLMVAGIPRY